ncbi:Asx homology domain-containing protein [Lasiosphaeris hirsuta]|uniref:Asx homology domain-containing protein n=1 Tax=Lasiosphaeris hirsuta TaxID=260670 RepID=A0AA40ARH4_9PEZI|nr:Asx homology domain-containing protein [Lasiosphaeris hirsuta]
MAGPADDCSSSSLSPPPDSILESTENSGAKDFGAITSDIHNSPSSTAAQSEDMGKGKATKSDDSIATHGSDDEKKTTSNKRKATSQGRKSSSTKNPRRLTSGSKKAAKDRKWEAPFVFSDPKSPLASADLRAILLLPSAWDVLTPAEKQAVLAKFPDPGHILHAGTEDARPSIQSLRNDDNFRHDCARYVENIELGRHDPEWLNQAWVAHEMHRRGEFDEYLQRKFEYDWDVELPEEHRRLQRRESEGAVVGGEKQSEEDSIAPADSPTTPENVKSLQGLTIKGTPPPSEPGSATAQTSKKRAKDDVSDDEAGAARSARRNPRSPTKNTSFPARKQKSSLANINRPSIHDAITAADPFPPRNASASGETTQSPGSEGNGSNEVDLLKIKLGDPVSPSP